MSKHDVIIEICITVDAETYEEATEASDKALSEVWNRLSPASFPYPIYIEQTDLIEMKEH